MALITFACIVEHTTDLHSQDQSKLGASQGLSMKGFFLQPSRYSINKSSSFLEQRNKNPKLFS